MRILLAVVLSFAIVAVGGCAFAPIQNLTNVEVASAVDQPLSADQVRVAITRAGSLLGWKMKNEGAGKLIGTLKLRTHTAVVEIPYSNLSYSLNYQSSVDLDEKDGLINKRYNSWILNLNRGIQVQLSGS
jgi:hypothetical protein